jgi:hypothetical protein
MQIDPIGMVGFSFDANDLWFFYSAGFCGFPSPQTPSSVASANLKH